MFLLGRGVGAATCAGRRTAGPQPAGKLWSRERPCHSSCSSPLPGAAVTRARLVGPSPGGGRGGDNTRKRWFNSPILAACQPGCQPAPPTSSAAGLPPGQIPRVARPSVAGQLWDRPLSCDSCLSWFMVGAASRLSCGPVPRVSPSSFHTSPSRGEGHRAGLPAGAMVSQLQAGFIRYIPPANRRRRRRRRFAGGSGMWGPRRGSSLTTAPAGQAGTVAFETCV